MCKLLLLIIYKNFQILTQPLCCQNSSESLPTNLKWTVQELLSCKRSLRAPAYWGFAHGRETTGSPRLACAGISQNLSTDIKKISAKLTVMGCWDTFPSLLPLPGTALF